MQVLSVGGICAATGLASASGLNAGIPVLTIGLLARFDRVSLASEYHFLGSLPMLALVGMLLLIDVIANKIPSISRAVRIGNMFAYPFAGAICFASQRAANDRLSGPLCLILGMFIAGSLQLARSVIRPDSDTTQAHRLTLISIMQDISAGVLTALALTVPTLAVLASALAAVGLGWMLWRSRKAFLGQSLSGTGQAQPSV
jgi:hypothetical protein